LEHYFLKLSSSPSSLLMFSGEYSSLSALSSVFEKTKTPFCPQPLGYGKCKLDEGKSFLLTGWIDFNSSPSHPQTSSTSSSSSHSNSSETAPLSPAPSLSLASKLATLHSSPTPIPEGYDKPMFGFAETTFCGDTPLENSFCENWSEFFASRRLRGILRRYEELHGEDEELRNLIEEVCEKVIGRLLGNGTLSPPCFVLSFGEMRG
jgi:fructosamine-3-kinase